MDSVNTLVAECAADIAYSLGCEDKVITIESYIHQYFNTPLSEHQTYIESLTGDVYDTEDYS